ncbi:MAG: hypothetical protein OEM52_12130, partial [bacterium]|nr:hypothetical protein [bacterium]
MRRLFAVLMLTAVSMTFIATVSIAQPQMTREGVRFSYAMFDGKSVAVAGNFNGWSILANPMILK